MPRSLELRFRYTEDEYVSALRTYMLAKKRVFFFACISLVVTLIGIYFLVTQSDLAATITFLCTGTFMLGVFASSFGLRPRQRFRADPRFRNEYQLDFREDEIVFQTNNVSATLKWDNYTEAIETDKFFLLAQGEGALTVIPKRVFSDGAQQAQFADLVSRKVAA